MDTTVGAVRISGGDDGLRIGEPGEALNEVIDRAHGGVPVGTVRRLAVAAGSREVQSALEGRPVIHS